jgi:Fic family protein
MQTFRNLDQHLGSVPAGVARDLGWIDQAAGREIGRRAQFADALQKLVAIARVQSTEASNAIENIHAPPERIEALLKENTAPENRSEAEIAGYRDVLDLIHSNSTNIPLSLNVELQFHRDLYRYTAVRHAGDFKSASNEVTETRPDGTTVVRFKPVDPGDTRLAMEELHERFDEAMARGEHHPLLLLAAYVFDFLMIHPFQDGNGRMARLLTLLRLYHDGYQVGRYISLERLINDSRETYYDSLGSSTGGWHESQHDIWPWARYLLGILIAAYKEFEGRLELVGHRGAKTEAIKQFIRSSLAEEFTLDDIRKATPAVSDAQIRKVLGELKTADSPAVERVSSGRYARWRRLRDDF